MMNIETFWRWFLYLMFVVFCVLANVKAWHKLDFFDALVISLITMMTFLHTFSQTMALQLNMEWKLMEKGEDSE